MVKFSLLLILAALLFEATSAYPFEDTSSDSTTPNDLKHNPIVLSNSHVEHLKNNDSSKDNDDSTETYIEETYIEVLLPNTSKINSSALDSLLNSSTITSHNSEHLKRSTDLTVHGSSSNRTLPASLYSHENRTVRETSQESKESSRTPSTFTTSGGSTVAPHLYLSKHEGSRILRDTSSSESDEDKSKTSNGSTVAPKNLKKKSSSSEEDSSSSENSSEEKSSNRTIRDTKNVEKEASKSTTPPISLSQRTSSEYLPSSSGNRRVRDTSQKSQQPKVHPHVGVSRSSTPVHSTLHSSHPSSRVLRDTVLHPQVVPNFASTTTSPVEHSSHTRSGGLSKTSQTSHSRVFRESSKVSQQSQGETVLHPQVVPNFASTTSPSHIRSGSVATVDTSHTNSRIARDSRNRQSNPSPPPKSKPRKQSEHRRARDTSQNNQQTSHVPLLATANSGSTTTTVPKLHSTDNVKSRREATSPKTGSSTESVVLITPQAKNLSQRQHPTAVNF